MKNLLIAFAMVFAIGSSADAADVNVRGYYEFLRLVTQHVQESKPIAATTMRLSKRKAAKRSRSKGKSKRFVAKKLLFGGRCVTPKGWCPIQPQPVGSPCKCGQATGTTLQ